MFAKPLHEHDILESRLRFFVLSGIGKYTHLPSPGIGHLWTYLYTMGGHSRFCLQSVLPEREREELQRQILNEATAWLEEISSTTLLSVKVVGDENTPNGLLFRTTDAEVKIIFEFALQGKGLRPDSIGSWNVYTEIYAVH